MSQLIENTSMGYYDINEFLKDEDKFDFILNVKIEGNKLYRGTTPNKKIELPVFAAKFLLENEMCQLYRDNNTDKSKVIFEMYKNDLNAQADIVDLSNNNFYTFINMYKNKNMDNLIECDENNDFIVEVFKKRMGVFGTILIKRQFSEEDVAHLSVEEKRVVVEGRKIFQTFDGYQINVI